MTFPIWNHTGTIPSIRPGKSGHDPDRSPYKTTLNDVFDYFCSSAERLAICRGLLEYRARLHAIGLRQGFQWINGSFAEDVETNEARSPGDVDVVTFFEVAPNYDMHKVASLEPDLFDIKSVKAQYHVDGYFFQLGFPQRANEIERVSYWYSMWSHRRDGLWKGFVQVDLDPGGDSDALDRINAIAAQMGLS
ncbi:DUF6932 family protein [Salipiger bermudensis]|uniref:DUF6932 family protein n=1 Tax=Salipiger bermudensis TaxID=344736 RepID=UPI0035145D19